MTLSVLEGEEGNQSRELHKLLEFLGRLKPEIVHLTNSLFLGMAGPIRSELGIPVLCAVQGEDLFLSGLREPFRSQVRSKLRHRARDASAFLAASRYYADHMTELLDIPAEKMHVIPLGLKLDGHGTAPERADEGPFTVGYLARIAPEKGLHALAEAFHLLAQETERENVRLRVAGWLGARDEKYFEGVKDQLASWKLEGCFEYIGEVDRDQKIRFLPWDRSPRNVPRWCCIRRRQRNSPDLNGCESRKAAADRRRFRSQTAGYDRRLRDEG